MKPYTELGLDADESEDDLAYAIGLYVLGGISLGKAAEMVGVSRWRMEDFLEEIGLEIRDVHGPRDVDELQRDVDVAMSLGDPAGTTDTDGEE